MGTQISTSEEDDFVRLVEGGLPLRTAANAIGRPYQSFETRIRKSPGFSARVRRARAALEERLLKSIMAHTSNDWKAALVLLERLFPSRWSKPETRPVEKVETNTEAASDRAAWVEMNVKIPGRAVPKIEERQEEEGEESLEDI